MSYISTINTYSLALLLFSYKVYTGKTSIVAMASNCQTKKSGMETIEYKKLKENMSTVTDTIEVVLTAKESLITKFKESAWMSTTVKSASASSLVSLALNRIKIDVNDHLKFVDMLRGITGMDQIVAILNGM